MITVPTLIYASETWVTNPQTESRIRKLQERIKTRANVKRKNVRQIRRTYKKNGPYKTSRKIDGEEKTRKKKKKKTQKNIIAFRSRNRRRIGFEQLCIYIKLNIYT